MILSEHDVCKALALTYPWPEYLFLRGVRSETGYSSGRVRYADAMAMGLWPSRGLDLHGFEIKSARGDWLKELADPEKAEETGKHCHYYWIAAGSDEIVKPDELPPLWGLLVPAKVKMKVVKRAQRRDPPQLTYKFMASILRRAYEDRLSAKEAEKIRTDEYQRGYDEGSKWANYHLKQFDELKKKVYTFEHKSGIKLEYWDEERLGNLIYRLYHCDGDMVSELEKVRNIAAAFCKDVEVFLENRRGVVRKGI